MTNFEMKFEYIEFLNILTLKLDRMKDLFQIFNILQVGLFNFVQGHIFQFLLGGLNFRNVGIESF